MSDPYLESFEQFLDRAIARPGVSHHVQVAGRRLHYLEWPGPADAPTLLLLHGFLAHAHWWDFVAPSLAENYRVIAPDFSGMGDSEYRDDYTHAHFDEEVTGLIETLGIAGCTAIGHSFGGRILLYACLRQPQLIARAIVVDSRLGSPADPIGGFDEDWRPKKRYADAQTILQRFVLRPVEPAPAKALQHMGHHSVREEHGQWAWKFDENVTRLYQGRRNMPRVDDTLELRNLQTPVDFVYGEESKVVTPPRARLLEGCLPNVLSVTGLPSCHHHLPVSQPIALLGVLRVLLQQHVE
ncbi:MAG: alpha/beta hydrolase [Pseudomonadota bacterium]